MNGGDGGGESSRERQGHSKVKALLLSHSLLFTCSRIEGSLHHLLLLSLLSLGCEQVCWPLCLGVDHTSFLDHPVAGRNHPKHHQSPVSLSQLHQSVLYVAWQLRGEHHTSSLGRRSYL